MTTASVDQELDAVIEARRDAWLREAEATLMALDPHGFTVGPLAVIDFQTLGAPAKGYFGFVAGAQLHELARELLPPGVAAAVAVNVERIARVRAAGKIDSIGPAITVIAGHELAHVLDHQAREDRLPPDTTLEGIVRSLTDGRARDDAHRRQSHGPGWTRAFLHLLARASRLHEHRAWVEGFILDAAAVLPHPGDAYFDELRPELLATKPSDRLVDVLRTPAPAGFMSLFSSNPSGTTPGKES